MTTYKELLREKLVLDQKLEEARLKEVETVVSEIKQKMAEYNLVPDDLGLGKRRARSSVPVQPKYRNPATGEVWSGRGRSPRWIEGNKNNFLINK